VATEGPRTKGEALVQVADIVAGWMDGQNIRAMFPGKKLSDGQVTRIAEAVEEVQRRLRAMGPRR
jgi:hypothetical protein